LPKYVRREIVWVPFPFSAEEGFKLRPVVVITSWPRKGSTDYFLCMMSTQPETDPYLMELTNADLVEGHISRTCYIRPTYSFTATERFIESRFGKFNPEKLRAVVFSLFTVLIKE